MTSRRSWRFSLKVTITVRQLLITEADTDGLRQSAAIDGYLDVFTGSVKISLDISF
jgi:hypothetical protein